MPYEGVFMPFVEMMKELYANAMHSTPQAFVGAPLIFIYFAWIMYRAVKQIRVFIHEDEHH